MTKQRKTLDLATPTLGDLKKLRELAGLSSDTEAVAYALRLATTMPINHAQKAREIELNLQQEKLDAARAELTA